MVYNKSQEQISQRFNKPFFKFQDDQLGKRESIYSIYGKKEKKDNIIILILKLVISMLFELFVTILLVLPFVVLKAVFQFFKFFFTTDRDNLTVIEGLINPIMQVIIGCSTIGLLVKCAIDYRKLDDIQHLWFLNAFYLFATQLLITTYIKSVKHNTQLKQTLTCANFFGEDNLAVQIYNISSSSVQNNHQKESTNYIFDIKKNQEKWEAEYKNMLDRLEVDLDSQTFNTFFSEDNNPTTCDYKGYQLLSGQNMELPSGRWQYLSLTFIAFVKILLTLIYLYKFSDFQYNKIISITILTLFYINNTYILSKILGSYDLRRKAMIVTKLNEALLLSGGVIDYFTKIDILSTISIETWDNTRRVVLDYFKDEQKRLEACYVCLFFYYIFVSIICVTAYGEVYIFISQDSIYLHPIMVISNTLDFVFLNVLLFNRIYNGQKFNDTFGETNERIDSLIGVVEDLSQIYDYYFNKPGIDEQLYLNFTQGSQNHKINISALPKSNQSNQIQSNIQMVKSPMQNNIQMIKSPKSPQINFEYNSQLDYPGRAIDLQNSKIDDSHINNLLDIPKLVPVKFSQNTQNSQNNYLGERNENNNDEYDDQDKWSLDNDNFYTIYDIFVAKLKYNSLYYIDNTIKFQGQIYEFHFRKELHLKMLENSFQSLIRIKEQLEIDSKIKCYKFLGIIKVEFQETLITVVLAVLTILPKVLETFINFYKQ